MLHNLYTFKNTSVSSARTSSTSTSSSVIVNIKKFKKDREKAKRKKGTGESVVTKLYFLPVWGIYPHRAPQYKLAVGQ